MVFDKNRKGRSAKLFLSSIKLENIEIDLSASAKQMAN